MAMSCGVPCVATAVGAQGEVLGNFGVAVEAGSPTALQRGLSRVLEMTAERRAFMVHEARKHIWQNFRMARSIERLHELYIELAPEALRTSLAKATGSQSANSLPPDLAVFVPPPKAQPALVAQTVPDVKVPEAATSSVSATEPQSNAATEAKSILKIQPKEESAWSLDAALATTVQNVAKASEIKVDTDAVEWSAEESELISSMMTEADPATIKPLVIERPKPKPVAVSSVVDAQLAEAKARAARLMEARRAELRSTTATAHEKVPPPGKTAKA